MRPIFAAALGLVALAAALPHAAHAQTAPACPLQIASGTLTPPFPGTLKDLIFHDERLDPSAPAGHFYAVGSVPASRGTDVQRLTRKGWQSMGDDTMGVVTGLASIPDGRGLNGGPSLYAMTNPNAQFPSSIGRWDAITASWQPVLPSLGGAPIALLWFDDQTGGGPALHSYYYSLKKLENGAWRQVCWLDGPASWTRNRVFVLDEDGDGPLPEAIYFCGGVQTGRQSDNSPVSLPSGIARWDGRTLSELPNPLLFVTKTATIYDDDGINGPALIISGHCTGTGQCTGILRWNTHLQDWRPLQRPGDIHSAALGLAVLPGRAGLHAPMLIAVEPSASLSGSIPGSNFGFSYGRAATFDGVTWNPGGLGSFSLSHLPTELRMLAAGGTLGADALSAGVPAVLVPGPATSGVTPMYGLLPCQSCRADFNRDGSVSVVDVLTFLEDFLEQHASSDIAPSFSPPGHPAHIYEFLNRFFTGCP